MIITRMLPFTWALGLSTTIVSMSLAAASENHEPIDYATQIQTAQSCTQIPARLARLSCFDDVFNTSTLDMVANNKGVLMPESWQRAQNSEAGRKEGNGFAIHYLDEEVPSAGIWMTATAVKPLTDQVEGEAMPILLLSCFDNISRVELVLPEVSNINKATITVTGRSSVTQRWLSDDSGAVLRGGRGIPAIAVMNALLSSDKPSFRSDVTDLSGLMFDARELNRSIEPMRKACHW